ncbi:Protein of aldo/keto reductase family [Yarrowia lipolytica]|nr:Protein of aldo/keto reductase family [Yarrowia lipolytica]
MSLTTSTITLNDGRAMPALGLGTFQNDACEQVVYDAIKAGYRHIDTAFIYRTEEAVGNAVERAIFDGIVARSDLWITTKVWPTYHDRVPQSVDKSLALLKTDYIDLLLVHWPVALNGDPNDDYSFLPKREDGEIDITEGDDWISFYKQLETEQKTGRVKSIGVSNVSSVYLERLLEHASVIPAVNQFENHPLLPQKDQIEANLKQGIQITAYSPLGSGQGVINLHENPTIVELAEKYNTSTASILINWHICQGRSVIPKTANSLRVVSNAVKVEISAQDLAKIDAISAEHGTHRTVPFHLFKKDCLGYPV